MGEAGFTPGPWSTAEIHKHGFYGNLGEAMVIGPNGRVAVVDCISSFKRGQGSEAVCAERDSNARLIAAAPAGYEFAEAHDAYMLDAGYSGPDDAALHPKAAENWRRCRAYLALARNTPVSDKGEGE